MSTFPTASSRDLVGTVPTLAVDLEVLLGVGWRVYVLSALPVRDGIEMFFVRDLSHGICQNQGNTPLNHYCGSFLDIILGARGRVGLWRSKSRFDMGGARSQQNNHF